jgi:[protein-PII] uridylyltransferase
MAEHLGRDALVADSTLVGADWCQAYSDRVDGWLVSLFDEAGAPKTVALCAIGGYGRAELCPQSDIDVVLLHKGHDDIATIAERLWYPVWDEGLKLGHGVRTVKEAVHLAASDLDTATSLLDVRLLAGDEELADTLRQQALELWQKRSRRWLAEVGERVAARQRKAGEVAFLLEPDLKEGRGGLRDVHAMRWADLADRVTFEGDSAALDAAYNVLLAARVELHRRASRPGDILLLQEQDAVAEALGDTDADALMSRVASAARTIAWRSDEVWDRVNAALKGGMRWRSSRDRVVAPGCVLRDGRMALTADADPAHDPVLVLRLAATAAEHGVRIDRGALERLAAESAPLPEPWPEEARDAFLRLLGAGSAALWVFESLDQVGLWVRLLPEWAPNRNRPQRNAYHRFTVDRHLMEAAVLASALVDRVDRADLLLLGALLHDVGKGYPGDHSVVGVDLIRAIGSRLGYPDEDLDVLEVMVRQHLLLPDVATRRDLSDEATIEHVAHEVGNASVLRLLGALTEADSIATGPAAWGSWKAELVADLVARTAAYFGEVDPDRVAAPEFPTAEQWAWLEAREPRVVGVDDRLTILVPDRPGLFSRVAGVLSLHGLDVLDAAAFTHENGMALESFRVESSVSPTISWSRVVADVERALAGRLAIQARLAERAHLYGRATRPRLAATAPTVKFDVDMSPAATVVEVYAPDAIGVLYRATRALAELDLDIRSAKVQTLGPEVVDSFYVVDGDGRKITDETHLAEIERAVLHALS